MKQNSDSSIPQFGNQLRAFLQQKSSFAPFVSYSNILESTTKLKITKVEPTGIKDEDNSDSDSSDSDETNDKTDNENISDIETNRWVINLDSHHKTRKLIKEFMFKFN